MKKERSAQNITADQSSRNLQHVFSCQFTLDSIRFAPQQDSGEGTKETEERGQDEGLRDKPGPSVLPPQSSHRPPNALSPAPTPYWQINTKDKKFRKWWSSSPTLFDKICDDWNLICGKIAELRAVKLDDIKVDLISESAYAREIISECLSNIIADCKTYEGTHQARENAIAKNGLLMTRGTQAGSWRYNAIDEIENGANKLMEELGILTHAAPDKTKFLWNQIEYLRNTFKSQKETFKLLNGETFEQITWGFDSEVVLQPWRDTATSMDAPARIPKLRYDEINREKIEADISAAIQEVKIYKRQLSANQPVIAKAFNQYKEAAKTALLALYDKFQLNVPVVKTAIEALGNQAINAADISEQIKFVHGVSAQLAEMIKTYEINLIHTSLQAEATDIRKYFGLEIEPISPLQSKPIQPSSVNIPSTISSSQPKPYPSPNLRHAQTVTPVLGDFSVAFPITPDFAKKKAELSKLLNDFFAKEKGALPSQDSPNALGLKKSYLDVVGPLIDQIENAIKELFELENEAHKKQLEGLESTQLGSESETKLIELLNEKIQTKDLKERLELTLQIAEYEKKVNEEIKQREENRAAQKRIDELKEIQLGSESETKLIELLNKKIKTTDLKERLELNLQIAEYEKKVNEEIKLQEQENQAAQQRINELSKSDCFYSKQNSDLKDLLKNLLGTKDLKAREDLNRGINNLEKQIHREYIDTLFKYGVLLNKQNRIESYSNRSKTYQEIFQTNYLLIEALSSKLFGLYHIDGIDDDTAADIDKYILQLTRRKTALLDKLKEERQEQQEIKEHNDRQNAIRLEETKQRKKENAVAQNRINELQEYESLSAEEEKLLKLLEKLIGTQNSQERSGLQWKIKESQEKIEREQEEISALEDEINELYELNKLNEVQESDQAINDSTGSYPNDKLYRLRNDLLELLCEKIDSIRMGESFDKEKDKSIASLRKQIAPTMNAPEKREQREPEEALEIQRSIELSEQPLIKTKEIEKNNHDVLQPKTQTPKENQQGKTSETMFSECLKDLESNLKAEWKYDINENKEISEAAFWYIAAPDIKQYLKSAQAWIDYIDSSQKSQQQSISSQPNEPDENQGLFAGVFDSWFHRMKAQVSPLPSAPSQKDKPNERTPMIPSRQNANRSSSQENDPGWFDSWCYPTKTPVLSLTTQEEKSKHYEYKMEIDRHAEKIGNVMIAAGYWRLNLGMRVYYPFARFFESAMNNSDKQKTVHLGDEYTKFKEAVATARNTYKSLLSSTQKPVLYRAYQSSTLQSPSGMTSEQSLIFNLCKWYYYASSALKYAPFINKAATYIAKAKKEQTCPIKNYSKLANLGENEQTLVIYRTIVLDVLNEASICIANVRNCLEKGNCNYGDDLRKLCDECEGITPFIQNITESETENAKAYQGKLEGAKQALLNWRETFKKFFAI